MADDYNEAGRYASRAGNHELAERLFSMSANEGNSHSAANVVYERYLQGKASAEDVKGSVYSNGLQNGGHGKWLLDKVR
jgi:hypothetical protein